jgi:hypothetical protein
MPRCHDRDARKCRDENIVRAYSAGDTLREVALAAGVSMQRAHQIIDRDAPHLMREPHIGKGVAAAKGASGVVRSRIFARYPLAAMEVGQSFLIDGPKAERDRSATLEVARRLALKVASRKVAVNGATCYRVWRFG